MKSKLFLKASSLVCALALLVTGIHTAFAADRDYTVKKQYTVTNASAVKAVELYKLRNSKVPGNMSLKEQGEDHLTMSATDNNNTLFGVVTEVDGIDLTSSELTVDEWSYDMTFAKPELNGNASFGYIYDWSKVGSTVAKQEDGTYSVTNGDTEFYCLGSDIKVNSDGYYFAQLGDFTQFGGQIFGSPITIAEDGTFTYGTSRNSTYNSAYGFYWKDTPTLKVSYVKSGENEHTYTVKAVNIYTNDGTGYVEAEDKTIRTFTVDGSKAFDTGYVLFGASQYTKNGTDIVISNISVTYNKTLDYSAECEQFLTDNPIVEKLYDGTFAPTKDTADTLKAQLNTALSQYKTFEEDEKTVFDNNFPSFESKVSAALKECTRAAYGTVTTEKTVDATAISVDVATVYTARSGRLDGIGKYAANGAEATYTVGNNYNVTLGAITEINGVDLTSSDVSVKGWSYTMEFGQNNAPLGFLASWKNFNTVISNDDGNYTVTPGDGTYYQIYGGQSVTNATDNSYLTGKGFQEGGLVEYTETIAADGVVTSVTENQNIWGKHFKDSDSTVLYWKGTPVITVSMTENADGETYTYTVTAKDLYYTDGTEYGDKVIINNTSAVNPEYVLIGAGNYSYNGSADNTISFKDIKVKYTQNVDITDECVTVLEAGNGMINRLDGIVTKANAADVAADVAELKAAYESASAEVKNAIDAKYAGVAAKIAYAEKYAYVAANKASPELKGINIKKVTSASASDLRFAVGYAADGNTDYTVAGYGAVVVLNQALEDKNAELTKDTAVKSGMENYFFDVYEQVTAVPVDNQGQFYVTITGSKGKPGTLIDCRPYVVYTDGDNNEFVLYASNDDTDKNISNGQASKCGIFAARDLSNAMNKVLGENVVYPDGYTKDTYDAIISKIGNTATTSAEKNVVYQFLYENCDAYVKALG